MKIKLRADIRKLKIKGSDLIVVLDGDSVTEDLYGNWDVIDDYLREEYFSPPD
jgi:hypothetical protein